VPHVEALEALEGCPLCRRGQMVGATVDFTFRQMTDRGRVTCHLPLPISACSHCGFEMLGTKAETEMDEAVRREYDRLPPVSKDDE